MLLNNKLLLSFFLEFRSLKNQFRFFVRTPRNIFQLHSAAGDFFDLSELSTGSIENKLQVSRGLAEIWDSLSFTLILRLEFRAF